MVNLPTPAPSAVLKLSGYRAVIEPDRFIPGSFTLVVDGTPQSSVNLENPTALFFEYIQRMGHVIDELDGELPDDVELLGDPAVRSALGDQGGQSCYG